MTLEDLRMINAKRDAPTMDGNTAGRVAIEYTKNGRFVDQVRLFNVASYLHAANGPT